MSMFYATRPDTYRTPDVWRTLIEIIAPHAPVHVVNNILDKGVTDKKTLKEIEKLRKRYEYRIKLGYRLKNLNPRLFSIALKMYQRLWKMVFSVLPISR